MEPTEPMEHVKCARTYAEYTQKRYFKAQNESFWLIC